MSISLAPDKVNTAGFFSRDGNAPRAVHPAAASPKAEPGKGAREINDDIDFFAPKTYNKHVIEVKKIGGWFPFFAAGGLRPPAILRKVVVFECPKTQRLAVRLY